MMDAGFDEGEAQGRASGAAEGWELGCVQHARAPPPPALCSAHSLRKGAQLGSELGAMAGSVAAWRAAGRLTSAKCVRRRPTLAPWRTPRVAAHRQEKLASDIEALCTAFPFDVRGRSAQRLGRSTQRGAPPQDPRDETLLDVKQRAVAKFKVLCAVMKVPHPSATAPAGLAF